MIDAYICAGVRTPFGRYGGSLSGIRADDLAAVPIRALLQQHTYLESTSVDEVILGCANQAGEDNRNVARMALLLAGLPVVVPGVTVNRLCGSGLDAVASAARLIQTGDAEVVIAGGVESMTRAPYVLGKSGSAFGRSQEIEDTTMGWRFINPAMADLHGVDTMPETAEFVAAEYGISREDQDAFALRSQQRTEAAIANGRLGEEIVAVSIAQKKGSATLVTVDEQPRSDTTLEALARLRPITFPTGTVTAGNASGINDGAAALLLASPTAIQEYGLTPLAKVLGSATAGIAPRIMGMGPVPATRKLLSRLNTTVDKMDVIELNEAFAAQAIAVLRELNIQEDAAHVNPNGGAIALGHPLGASGARLVLTAARELQRGGGRFALCTMCIGVGQGIALALENIQGGRL